MKKKVNLLSLSKNELKNAKAGEAGVCYCGCLYAGEQDGDGDDYYGGSSIEDNGEANGGESGSIWYH